MSGRPGTGIRLTADQIARVDASLRDIHDILPDIDRARSCGVNCEEHAEMAAFLQNRLMKLKQEFAPIKQG